MIGGSQDGVPTNRAVEPPLSQEHQNIALGICQEVKAGLSRANQPNLGQPMVMQGNVVGKEAQVLELIKKVVGLVCQQRQQH